jgi:hypothetical protein
MCHLTNPDHALQRFSWGDNRSLKTEFKAQKYLSKKEFKELKKLKADKSSDPEKEREKQINKLRNHGLVKAMK